MRAVERFEALDAWRGICALVVAVEHLPLANILHHNAFVRHGARFVDFFFVLSGFVIAHAYGNRLATAGQVKTFLLRRIGRLWPLHLVTLALVLGAELSLHFIESAGRTPFADRNTLPAVLTNVLMIHSWGIHQQLTWNTPSWSISTEMFAYVMFAGACWLTSRHRSALLAMLGLAGLLIIVLIAPAGMGSTYDFGLARCVYGFTMGALVRSIWNRVAPPRGTAVEVVTITCVVASVSLIPNNAWSILVTPIFAVAVWIFAAESGAVSQALRRRIPQRLGEWSYSIYMVHALIVFALLTGASVLQHRGVHVLERVGDRLTFVGSQSFTTTVLVGYISAVVLASFVSYRFVERPGRRSFRSLEGSP